MTHLDPHREKKNSPHILRQIHDDTIFFLLRVTVWQTDGLRECLLINWSFTWLAYFGMSTTNMNLIETTRNDTHRLDTTTLYSQSHMVGADSNNWPGIQNSR